MDAFSSRLTQRLRDRATERMSILAHGLAITPAQDYASYMKVVGQVQGIKEFLEFMQEVEVELTSPEKDETQLSSRPKRYEE